MSEGYESFFGLAERPFSLTSDPRYFFKSRSHGRAVETLTFVLRSRERFLAVTGDLGVGKTMLCRTVIDQLRRRGPVSYVSNPLLAPDAFSRLLLEDLGVASLADLAALPAAAVLIVDEAHTLPALVAEQLLSLAELECDGCPILQFVLVGQSAPGDPARLGIRELDELATTRIRLLPLGREECGAYVEHRLTAAGASHRVQFSSRALDYVFALSGGLPRLVNLLCERALQEAATSGSQTIEPATIDLAAATLQLLRARSRRFRWFTNRVS
ncbi:MAG TPA: AAA family ATPase [Vicinamibacterales bacterium]|nr:AAA family ATPase [Vicinamibacterales bacterium]